MSTLCQCLNTHSKPRPRSKCLLNFSPKLATTQPFAQCLPLSYFSYISRYSRGIRCWGGFFLSKGELLHPRYLPKNRISLQPINKNGIRESVTTIFVICLYKEPPPHSDLTFFLYFKCILFRPIGAKLTS